MDQLAYYRHLQPDLQAASSKRQSDMHDRLLPGHSPSAAKSAGKPSTSLEGKLAGLIIRAPITGVVTAIDLKVGELRNPGERLAEVTPETGMKLSADVKDEFYLARVHGGQSATMDVDGTEVKAHRAPGLPQVKNGQFSD